MAGHVVYFIPLLVVLTSSALCKPNMSNSYDTIVVGLGSAGVTAASTLAKAGKKVLGLEADSRIGGRVKTVPFGDGVVELGAEWIHGTHHSRVYDSAIQNNVTVLEQDLTSEVFRSDGKFGDNALFNELTHFCMDAVEQTPKEPQPLGQYITGRLMEYLKEKHPEVLKDQDYVEQFLETMNLFTNNYEASNDWNDVTTHTTYEDLQGPLHASWHRHGYKTFFEILLNTYNNGPGLPTLDIKLNKEVTQIKWPKDSTGEVEVTCKDGEKYTANNVIVTVSLGVLKERYATLFSPMLPPDKIIAIDKITMGLLDKIILSFPEKWRPTSSWYFFFWTKNDVKELHANDKWLSKLMLTSFPMGSSNSITIWCNGDVAKMVETLPEDVVKTKSVELLRRFMGTNVTIPEPTGIIRSTWFSNPFTRGSYTHDNLMMPQHPNARSVLGAPLVDAAGTPKVLFAGEATDLTHFSTVHGASDSGYREAMRLLPASKI